MPIHKREIYLAKVFGKEPYWPFHFPEKNVIYDFYGSKQLEQVSKAEPTIRTNYFRSSNFFLWTWCSQKTIIQVVGSKNNLWTMDFETTSNLLILIDTGYMISKGGKSYNVSFSSIFYNVYLTQKCLKFMVIFYR